MNIVLVPREVRDLDSVLGFLMMTGVLAAACAVIYFLGRHHHRQRKAKKNARGHKNAHPRTDTSIDEG